MTGWELGDVEPLVAAVVRNRVRLDPGAAEDVTQEAMIGLWLALPRQRQDDEDEPRKVAVTIAKRRAADHWRQTYRARAVVVLADHEDGLPDAPDAEPGPEARAVAAEASRALWALVAGLSARQRAVVELRFGAGWSIAEIATMLGVSEVAVRMAQFYGLRRLRDLLEVAQ